MITKKAAVWAAISASLILLWLVALFILEFSEIDTTHSGPSELAESPPSSETVRHPPGEPPSEGEAATNHPMSSAERSDPAPTQPASSRSPGRSEAPRTGAAIDSPADPEDSPREFTIPPPDLPPPLITHIPPFRGRQIPGRRLPLQVAVALPPGPHTRGLITVATEEGAPIGELKVKKNTRSLDAEVGVRNHPSRLDWRVFDLVIDPRRAKKHAERFEELPWIVTVEIESHDLSETNLRTGVGRLEVADREGAAPHLVEVITEDVRRRPAIEVPVPGGVQFHLRRRSWSGTNPVGRLRSEWREGETLRIPELGFPLTEIVRFSGEGIVPRDLPFLDLADGVDLEFETGAVATAVFEDLGIEYHELYLEVVPAPPAEPRSRQLATGGEPIRWTPVPSGSAELRLRLRRDVLWERSVFLLPGETDITDLVPPLESWVRAIDLTVDWPQGETGRNVRATVVHLTEQIPLLPFMDEQLIRQEVLPNEHNRLLVAADDTRTATLELLGFGSRFEPVEVDLSLSEWFIEAVLQDR